MDLRTICLLIFLSVINGYVLLHWELSTIRREIESLRAELTSPREYGPEDDPRFYR